MDESFLKSLNVLYVEDEVDIIQLVEKRFAPKFNQFLSVTSAEEALEIFKQNSNFDLILTDYLLPGLNGIEFARKILQIKSKVPFILITGYVDMQFLIEAINVGITQFVSKPIQFKLLRNAINNTVESVVLEHLLNKSREKELELLKYKDMYNTIQHDATLRKELHIMRNDMFKKYFHDGDNPVTYNGWQVEVFYKSLDIVSGDTYTCRTLDNGNVVIFIADAMGKGVSAAITSLVSVSLTNYIIKQHDSNKCISSEEEIRFIAEQCVSFMRESLVEDEVLCAIFAYFDFKENKLQYASFSMPRILLQTTTGSIEKLPSNNLPIMPYVVDIAIDSVDLSNVSKVALFTDGIVESETKDGVLYSAYLNENFSQSPFLKSFFNNAYTYLDDFYDDVTLFFIRRPFTNIIKEKVYYFPTKYDKLDEASETIRQEMVDCGIDVDRHDSFFTALSECIMNAYEHGNLAITFAIKHELIKNGDYEEELLKKEKNNDKMITIRYVYCNDNESKYIIVGIRDEGAGYPETVFKNAIGDTTKFNGRGIKIIDYYTDIFFFSEDRREIFIGIKIK
ncbi:fused response regulator/phosphatase [Mucispirillum schaedleri]|uniref:fused response regulator/phosphatase n=1 Tax=Mucispirillum schaedleri TaxID=248039 RepID=UPI001F5916F2|nr:fused response regulator/phosphatase [Mucispirillum schaedleri]